MAINPAQIQNVPQQGQFYPNSQLSPEQQAFKNFAMPMAAFLQGQTQKQQSAQEMAIKQQALEMEQQQVPGMMALRDAQARLYGSQADMAGATAAHFQNRAGGGAPGGGGGLGAFAEAAARSFGPTGALMGGMGGPIEKLAQEVGSIERAQQLVTAFKTGKDPETGQPLSSQDRLGLERLMSHFGIRNNYQL